MKNRTVKGFTIIELLIVVIVIGILAAAGLAKYQNFAETSRRKSCLGQLQSIETGLAVWETSNTSFAENAKCAFGFTPRTGKLTDTAATASVYSSGGTLPAITCRQTTVGGPANFYNGSSSGPLGSVIRDDNIWVCPSAVSRYYGGEIQNVPDDYMDTTGGGGSVSGVSHGGTPIGLGGRYLFCVVGNGNKTNSAGMCNCQFPAGWVYSGTISAITINSPSPSPQYPFKIAICGSYGTFGTSSGTSNVPGTSATNQGGPVGPDGSTLNRHSSRW